MRTRPLPLQFELLGMAVRIDCADAAVRERLGWCYAAAAPGGGAGAVELRIEVRGGGFAIAASGREEVAVADFAAAVRTANHELAHAVMLRRRQLFFVHAGVVAFGDRAVVLPGLSRAGKSTLVLALLQRGAALLSDELLVYDPGAAVALPFPRAVKVRDECVGYFADPAAGPPLDFVGGGEARFLRTPVAWAERASVRTVVVPRWQRGVDDVPRAITPGESVLALVQSALNFGSQKNASIDHLTALAAGASSFTLAWSDPHAAADRILAVEGGA